MRRRTVIPRAVVLSDDHLDVLQLAARTEDGEPLSAFVDVLGGVSLCHRGRRAVDLLGYLEDVGAVMPDAVTGKWRATPWGRSLLGMARDAQP